MMIAKRIQLLYALLLAATLPFMTACSSEDATSESKATPTDGKIKVHLRVAQAGYAATRASLWEDEYATDEEMMNIWTVVAVHDDGTNKDKVAAIYTCAPSGSPDQEVDDFIDDTVELPSAGTYRFYSFANMAATELNKLLFGGVNVIPSLPVESTNEIIFNKIISKTETELNGITLKADKVNNIAVQVNGNGFDPTDEDNGFGAKGIPMSNVQTIEVKEEGHSINLVVIRMLAKIKLQIYNDSGSDVIIKSITLTSVTKNPKEIKDGEKENLKLLPSLKSKDSETQDGHDTMDYIHGDIQPNLYNNPTQGDLTLDFVPDNNANSTIDATSHKSDATTKNPVEFTFYVNESENPTGKNFGSTTPDTHDFYHYFLKINMQVDGKAEEMRYALIDNGKIKVTDGEGNIEEIDAWNYIARNDYRIIPIVLDDYKLDMIPYDFPAIGVSPASKKEEDGVYTINFHDYGHFHLQPVVTKYSDNSYVPFTHSKPTETSYSTTTWGLVDDNFNESWSSWQDASKQDAYENDNLKDKAFYRIETSPATKDGDEAGGVPFWYKNNDNPTWSPDGKYKGPFIFGYIADPQGAITEDRKVYHEFSIYLYKKGMSTPRQMTYRLYMILDTKQMMYPRESAPRHPHVH